MLETFVVVENSRTALVVPHMTLRLMTSLSTLQARLSSGQTAGFTLPVEKADFDGGVPNLTVTIKDMSAMSFGELIGFFMFACGVSGYVLGINPFDRQALRSTRRICTECLVSQVSQTDKFNFPVFLCPQSAASVRPGHNGRIYLNKNPLI